MKKYDRIFQCSGTGVIFQNICVEKKATCVKIESDSIELCQLYCFRGEIFFI